MPKLPKNERDIRLIAKIEEYQKLYNIQNEKLAGLIGVSLKTLYNRKRKPDHFTILEIRAIAKGCHIPMEELVHYI